MSESASNDYVNRELSWLHFNARVLQEAADPRVPLFERLAFLGIFSSNLDEFFRVRVASLRSLLRLKKKAASADWMRRNLSRRVEVAFPMYDERLRREICALLNLQRRDNTKARTVNCEEQNAYVGGDGAAPVRAQLDTYRYYKAKLEAPERAGTAKSSSSKPTSEVASDAS